MSNQPSFEELVNSAVANVMVVVSGASDKDLKDLHDDTDDSRLDSLVADVNTVKSLNTEREMLLAQNKSLAEWNLSQQPKLEAAKQRVQSTYEAAQALQTEVTALKRQVDGVGQSRNLDTTLALMQAAASEAEELSETTAAEFSHGGTTSVDEFLATFIPQRQLSHARRVRCEKLAEMLQQERSSYGSHHGLPPVAAHRVPPPPQAWNAAPVNQGAQPYPQLPQYR